MYMFDPVLLIITIIFAVIGFIISGRLKSKFAKYSKTPMRSGLSGKEVAEKMLRDHSIHDVKVVSVEGQLTDHYDPRNRTVNLSRAVYEGTHIAAAAVAAHECGHAVQHARSYAWLQMRSALVPVVQIGTSILNFVLIAMLFTAFAMPSFSNLALLLMIIAQGLITLFTLVTLPVEIDASQRALVWLNSSRISAGEEQAQAKDALTWAGLTYLAAALGALVTLLYLVLQFTGRSDD